MSGRKAVMLPFCALLLTVWAFVPTGKEAWGTHSNESDLASICYDCHTLNAMLADNNTSFINTSSRTLPQMRTVNGGVSPGNYSPTGRKFGCTYCHNDALRTIQGKAMKDAFNPFLSKPSQHPVDRAYSLDSYRNMTLGVNTGSDLYMSNWDNSWTKLPNQLDCVECHDANGNGGVYPNHPAPGTGSRAAGVNPFMLKNTPAMDNGHAPDSFCMTTCHAGTAVGTAGWKMGHYGWGSFDNAGTLATLKEHDGTALKTSKCVDCHETHSTNAKPNLMGEQRQSIQNVDTANCTSLCHVDTAFLAKGHGKTGVGLGCSNCHSSAVSHRDTANPKRINGSWDTNPASLSQNFASNGIDDDFNGVIDDAGEAAFQYSKESNCSVTCHSNKHAHQGTIGATSGSASCLHCHDPHGKGVDNNVMMVRRAVMGATTTYQASGTDFYRSDNTSICDNPSCHPKRLGNTSTPGTILYDVQEHRDANVGVGTVCTSCHNHSSTTGGSSFAPVCNSCHTYPGQPVLGGTHVMGGAHNKHVASDNVGGYNFPCATCHYKYTHNQSGVTTASEWTSRFQASNVNIKFDGTLNPLNANGPRYAGVAADNTLADNVYAPGVGGTGACAGLYCHGNSASVASWPAGSNTTPAWNDNATGACGTCHRATSSVPPQTFAHAMHADNTTVGYGISCRKCHYQTTNNGTTISSRTEHLNRQSRVSFDTADPLVSSGSYSGSATVGDSGSTTGVCGNIYCHSPGNRMAPPFDNGALGTPDWKAGALACNACHGASGQTGSYVGMPSYANGSPKANTHGKHLGDNYTCKVCHWTTTTTDNTIANRAIHANGAYNVVNDNVAWHAFTYSASSCSAAACHGGFSSGPNMPAWGQTTGVPFGCDVCHKNTGGVAATTDTDDYSWNSGVMSKIRDSEWTSTGHGRTSGTYNSGRSPANFTGCAVRCHSSGVSHNAANNPFRLVDNLANTDFNDTLDPMSLKDNKVCLDCHSVTGATPSGSTLHVEENHFGLKHSGAGAQTKGGSFCWDCHDPHGDPNDYMVHDNVTKKSDGQYGVPDNAAGSRMATTFGKSNLNGESYNSVYDWGDYVDNVSTVTGLCQVCHSDPAGASGSSSGGAEYFSSTRYTATHNKQAGVQGERCTNCHSHGTDFTPSCNSCHGEPSVGSGAPPFAPLSGNRIWPSTVDNYSVLAGLGNHRARPASGVNYSSHDSFTSSSTGCVECHTNTPGSGSTHNQAANDNATMTNVVNHTWTGAGGPLAASWSGGALPGAVAGGSVVDDSCSNIDCHSPYYSSNTYRSGTPFPYRRYWINSTLWNCYTCHAYDGRTQNTGVNPRPGGTDNTMGTGSHTRHVRTETLDCTKCHASGGYAVNHKSGFVDWSFAGAPNPPGYPAVPANAYSVASGTASPTDNNTGAGHRAWGTCSNIYCHSIGQTASGGALTGAAGEYKSPRWDNTWGGKCGDCHGGDGATDNAASLIASGSHTNHVGTAPYAFGCAVCHAGLGRGAATHVDNGINLSFGFVGSVSLAPTVYSKGLAHVAGNGFGTCTVNYCHGTGTPGFTGGANQATGTTNVPTWGTASTGNCGSCHGAPNATTNYPPGTYVGTQNYPSSGAHARHISASDAAGPRITACTDCHTSEGLGTHVDGKVDFRARYDNTTATTKALTQTCDPCHALGVATAKANWDTVGSLDCLTCHGASTAYTYANATGRVAPNVAGDNSTYGSNATGHNRPSGSNYTSGNPPAQQTCTACHDLAISHIDGTDNTTYTGNRLLGTVNTVPGITTVSGMCGACHTRGTLSSPATKKNVNTHGNAGFPDRLEAVFADRTCNQCHEPHGMVNVTAAPTGVNLWMINPTITVTSANDNVSPVRLFNRTGAYSFDNTGTSSDLCRACHTKASNPGYPMVWNVGGQHAAPGYTGDERGKDCSGCHSHNQDDNTATVDGLMPLACNACHSYPGLDNSASVKQMSAGHAKHAGTSTDTTNTKGYDCTLCHYNYNHNQGRIAKGAAWPANYYDNVNINFDPSWNPGGTTYRGLAVPTTGNGGTGVCAGLYCHGNNATLNAGWAGSAATPAWSGIGTATCGTCHDAGTADTTPATTFSTKNHPVHINLTSKAYGPGLAAFSAGGNCAEGTGCHPKPLLRPLSDPAGTHVNNAKNLRSTATDNGELGATLGATQVCRNCHTTYTSTNVPTSGDALARTQANWDNNAYLLPCITCHNGTAAGTQATADIGGAGARAAAIEGTYFASGHGLYGFPAPLECGWCHSNTMGHIGAARPVATNPWRIGISSFTALGRMDSYCSTDICHGSAIPNNHTWIANGGGYVTSKETTDTHPTTTAAVGTNKGRWYQVPPSAHVPLFGNLLDNNYNKTGGTNNYVLCVSCHDPHGVGTAALPSNVRTFSGQNTDAKGNKMLRFNYSSGAPTALCSQCHI